MPVTLPGTGSSVATDTVTGTEFQRIKIDLGLPGSSVPLVGAADPLTTGATGIPVRPLGQEAWVTSFADTIAAGITSDFVERVTGSGVTRSQSASNLIITTGVTANAEYLARSAKSWQGALIARWKLTASQRTANQNLAIMLADSIGEGLPYTIISATTVDVTLTAHGFTTLNIGQSMMLGGITGAAGVPGRYAIAAIPGVNTIRFTVAGWPATGTGTLDLFGWHYARSLYSGVTATNLAFDTQRKGWANTAVTATINGTASPGHLAQVTADGRNVYLSDTPVASSTTPNTATRASQMENIPDDDRPLFFYIWSFNGPTAPASTTTWTLGFVSVERFANQPITIAGMKMQGTQAPLPVLLATTANVNVANSPLVTPAPNTATGAATFLRRLLTADSNLAAIKASAGVVNTLSILNDSATKFYVKLYNLAVAPTLASSVPVMTIPVPAGAHVPIDCGPYGIRFPTGIALAVTRGIADTDATALVANDGVINMVYT